MVFKSLLAYFLTLFSLVLCFEYRRGLTTDSELSLVNLINPEAIFYPDLN
jgi:hypothetical protein